MLKIEESKLDKFEALFPGIRETIMYFEGKDVPKCPHCESSNTAHVEVGIIGRTIHLAAATTKFHLIPNFDNSLHGNFFCNECRQYFNLSEFFRKE